MDVGSNVVRTDFFFSFPRIGKEPSPQPARCPLSTSVLQPLPKNQPNPPGHPCSPEIFFPLAPHSGAHASPAGSPGSRSREGQGVPSLSPRLVACTGVPPLGRPASSARARAPPSLTVRSGLQPHQLSSEPRCGALRRTPGPGGSSQEPGPGPSPKPRRPGSAEWAEHAGKLIPGVASGTRARAPQEPQHRGENRTRRPASLQAWPWPWPWPCPGPAGGRFYSAPLTETVLGKSQPQPEAQIPGGWGGF